MGKDFKFKLHEGSERANDFMKVFGRLEVCVTSFISELANLPRFDEPQYVYMIDLSELSYDERIRLADHLSERFGVALSEIDAQIAVHGVPILASDGVLTVENPHRWIDLDDSYDRDDDDEDYACAMTSDGYCMAAGSEDCDWHCPYSYMLDDEGED